MGAGKMTDSLSVWHFVLVNAGRITVAAPMVLLCILGIAMLFGRKLHEERVAALTQLATVVGFLGAVTVLVGMLVTGERQVIVWAGNWVELPNHEYEFAVEFQFDRLSVPFALLSFVLVGVVGAFARAYMHLEPGYHRFFLFYSMFLSGMVIAALAGTIETLFAGWELVGLSSAFLVAFFHERVSPVKNGLYVWSIYRLTDAAFLAAAVLLHQVAGRGDLSVMIGEGPWPEGRAVVLPQQIWFVGALLLVAIAGKSALVPFSGWLPRAMEGPTPSSAIFYGALSVHLGTYLLLRISPMLESFPGLSVAVIVIGFCTAVTAALVGRVQADIKSVLAYASLTQVGIIVMEIGFGLRYIPLVHIVGHACLRTLQFLRAPSLLHDYHSMESALGGDRPHTAPRWLARNVWWYRWALERAYLDDLVGTYFVRPFLTLMRCCDGAERWISRRLGSTQSRPARAEPSLEILEVEP
jgi:NAD(P)H-quinone oxidoreductase subunit 5